MNMRGLPIMAEWKYEVTDWSKETRCTDCRFCECTNNPPTKKLDVKRKCVRYGKI